MFLDSTLKALPFLSAAFCSYFICKVMKLETSRYIPLFALSTVFSLFILNPILTIPYFGIFYILELHDSLRYTLYWFFANTIWFEKSDRVVSSLTLLSTFFIVQLFLGVYLVSRLLKLQTKRAFIYYFSTLSLTVFLTLILTYTIYGMAYVFEN